MSRAAADEAAARELATEEEDPPPPCDPQTQARWYQLEALERALAGNTLVFLETGAGKTLIAVMLLRRFAHRIRSAAAPTAEPRFAVFLVPTVVLVTQQARVVRKHTDLAVAEFYGEMGVDFWDADAWRRKTDGAEVLVMTPQILLDNLRHCFFRLQDIPLLIFDECHHATGNSPYACILKEFYHPQLKSRPSDPIPRILGMTASLIKSKDFARLKYSMKISELENLMNAKVYTVASESVLSQYIPFATTRIIEYDDYFVKSELYNHTIRCLDNLKVKHLEILKGKLHGSYLENAEKRIKKLNEAFLYCISDLGVWLAAKAAEILQSNKESCVSFWGEKLDEEVERFIRNYIGDVNIELSEIILKMTKRGSLQRHIGEDFDADLQDGLLKSKVYFLIKSLLEYRHVQDLRCIVFVKRVITSIVLEALLSTINQMSGWSVRYMAGKKFYSQHQSRNTQMEIVDSFRSGKVHLIIATQILEEGLDVPSCNLIIRFDPATTVCSFIQSCGRARMQNSHYVLLIKRGDANALSKTEEFLKSGQIMREESQRLESTFCQPLPNTLCNEEFYVVQSTGAIVTLNSSVPLIYLFCSKLPYDEYFNPLPRFSIDKALGTCTLHLPMSSPVQTIYAKGKISIIKRVVCLNACRELHAVGALTDYLLPESGVPYEDEPDIVVDKYKEEQPDYFPEQLTDNWSSFCHRGFYYCYKISLEGCSETTTPDEIVLAVKCEMGPDFISNSFKLRGMQDYLSFTIGYVGVIHLNQEQVIVARRFQTRILSLLISNGLSEASNSIESLFEMQVSSGAVYLLLPVVSGKIDWCSIKFSSSEMHEGTNMNSRHSHSCKYTGLVQTECGPFCLCMLQNSIVETPHNGMFYAVSGLFLDLNANSPMRESVVSYKTHFKERYGLDLKCEDQRLLRASKLVKVRNFLHECNYKKEKESTNVFELPPELCKVVMAPVSANTLRCFAYIPSIMYRIQCMLLSMNLKVQLGPSMKQFDIPALKILEALTAKKCREEFSQESLETLGDSFLKYITTQHLFSKYKHQHEGMLTKMKKNLISNAALCQLACSNNLVGYIRSEAFNPETWTIPGVGYGSCGSSLRKLKSKRIADSVEALIGAYLSAAGEQAAYLFLKSLGMDIGFHEMPVKRKITIEPEEFINLKSLELMLDYNFSDPSLLVEALTHGSYQIAGTTACYQRLEFLGDAVLDHIFTDYFYHQYPECTPELLTDLRSASVNNSCYAHAAVKAGLHKYILHSSSALHKRMADYLDKFEQSFSGPSHGWESGICLPKVLGDVIESIAGAIYIDSKHNKEVVWRSMKRLLEPLATPDTLEIDPVKELHEFFDPKPCSIKYTVTLEDRVSLVTVEVQTKGTTYKATRTGLTKHDAKKLAAKSVLQDMKAANRTQHFANGISCTETS